MFINGVVGFLLVSVCFAYPQHVQYVPVPVPVPYGTQFPAQFPVGFGQPNFGANTNFASRFGDAGTGGGTYSFNSVSSSTGPDGHTVVQQSSDPGTGVLHTRFSDDGGASNYAFNNVGTGFGAGFPNPGVGTFHNTVPIPGGVATQTRFSDASGSGGSSFVSTSSGGVSNFGNPGFGHGGLASRFNDDGGVGGGSTSSFVSSSSSGVPGGSKTVTSVTNNGKTTTYVSGGK